MIPSILGSAVYQINIFIGTILGSLLPRGSVSFLYYADRIVELPLGVFAIAVGTAALPSFSEQVATGDFARLKNTISFSLRLILFITIPATLALIVLRVPIISVLFQRGAFDAGSTLMTAEALLFYALGLWAFSTIRIIDSAFYSIQDRKSPLKVAFLSIFVNLVGSVILMYPLQHGGLALATSLASAVNVLTLAIILRKKIGAFLDGEFYHSLWRTFIASLLMGGALLLVPFLIKWDNAGSLHSRLYFLIIGISVGLAVFLLSSRLLKNQELMMLIGAVKRRLPHKVS
jgi:putative peptidoglycan lipid II flippase